jgi:F-type H+-transporting ATPase subunit alpha
MKKVAGRLRLDLAQFRELEAFAAFGSDLDSASKAQLARGTRLVEILKQPQYRPLPLEEEVISVWAGTTGKLDDVPVEDVRRFDTEFVEFIKRDHAALADAIRGTQDLSDDTVSGLDSAMDAFKRRFVTSEGHPLVKDVPVEPLADEAVEQVQITKVVRK